MWRWVVEQSKSFSHLQILKVTKGEHSSLTFSGAAHTYQSPVPPAFADLVKPGDAVTFDIHLRSFVKPKASWEMNFEEKLVAAENAKNKGNTFFAVRCSGDFQ